MESVEMQTYCCFGGASTIGWLAVVLVLVLVAVVVMVLLVV